MAHKEINKNHKTNRQTDMKAFKKSIFALATVLAGTCLTACNDANEYEDAITDNPSWAGRYNDSLKIAHPESVADSYWVRGTGLKVNANGEEIQGYVESLDFIDDTYVVVRMSQGQIPESIKESAVMPVDDSNSDAYPKYEYTYSPITGAIDILKEVKDDRNRVSKVVLFSAVAVGGEKDIITVAHYGDIPVQTYMVRGERPAAPSEPAE